MKLIVLAPEDDNHTAPIKWAMEKAGQKVVCWAGLSWTDEGQSSLLIKDDDTMILGGHSVDPGDVIWVRKTSLLPDFVSTWHVHIVNDNDVRIWFNGIEVFGTGGGAFDTTLDVTPVKGLNVMVIRVHETLGATPTNHSQAGFEITR